MVWYRVMLKIEELMSSYQLKPVLFVDRLKENQRDDVQDWKKLCYFNRHHQISKLGNRGGYISVDGENVALNTREI